MSPASCTFFGIRKHFQTKWSCFEPNQPILTYTSKIEFNFNHYLAKQSLNWQNFQDGCPIFHRQLLWTIFLQLAFKFEISSTTFYKSVILFQSWNYKEWNLIFWFLSMCKLRRITHKFNIKPSGLYSICEWFAGVYTSIKTKKIKFHSYNKDAHNSVAYIIILNVLTPKARYQISFSV